MEHALTVEGLSKHYERGEHVQPLHRGIKEMLETGIASTFGRKVQPVASQEFWALKDVSFSVQRGEILGIIGRNGAGKSTLLHLIAGLTCPSEGTVTCHGQVSTLLGLGLGMHPELTGRENIRMAGMLYGCPLSHVQNVLPDIAAFAELEDFLDMPFKHYSSGMRARLSFATVIHLEHKEILLMDEVLAAGDIGFREKCYQALDDLTKQGKTILFATHAIARVADFCDRCLYLQSGNVTALGDAAEVSAQYRRDVQSRTG